MKGVCTTGSDRCSGVQTPLEVRVHDIAESVAGGQASAQGQMARYNCPMRRSLAGLLLTVLIGGPVASSVCEASCLGSSHVHVATATEGRAVEPTAAEAIAPARHDHHHVAVAEERSAQESAGWRAAGTGVPATLTTDDCCLDLTRVELVNIQSAKSPAATMAHVTAAPCVGTGRPDASTTHAVAHTLEPPADSIARHLSSSLRI